MSSNSFALVTKFVDKIDAIFEQKSVTSILSTPSVLIDFMGANVVRYPKVAMDGLADVDKDGDIVAGGVQLTWSTNTMAGHRARSFKVHKTDNEETLGAAFGYIASEFVRTKSVPEVDAYRIAKMATAATTNSENAEATLTDSTTEAALKAGILSMKENDAWAEEGMICFMTPTVKAFLEADAGTKTALVQPGTNAAYDDRFPKYNGMSIIEVPQAKMYTIIDLTAAAAGGYAKNASGLDINFLIVNPNSIIQVVKHEIPRFFAPTLAESNRFGGEGAWTGGNQWKFDYEIYHDLFVYDNKVDGLYLHSKAT